MPHPSVSDSAFRELDARECSDALYLAIEFGELGTLREYVELGKPTPDEPVLLPGWSVAQPMSDLVAELFGRSQPQQHPVKGRPARIAADAPPAEQAERNAAWLVAFMLKGWRSRHGRKRVPRSEADRIVTYAVEEAANAFNVPLNAIKESNIRTLLQNGRIVVR